MSDIGAKGDGNVETSELPIAVSAPGKVILHGEHSVVYGKLAVAGSLDLRTAVRLIENDARDAFDVESATLGVDVRFDSKSIKSLLETPLPLLVDSNDYNYWDIPNLLDHDRLLDRIDDFLDKSNVRLSHSSQMTCIRAVLYLCAGILSSARAQFGRESVRLVVTTDLTTGAGMGSSASFSVSVAAAFLKYLKRLNPPNKDSPNDDLVGDRPKQSQGSKESQASKESEGFSAEASQASKGSKGSSGFSAKELEFISRWAFNAERIAHGAPSGLDNTACTYGSLIEFRRGAAPALVGAARPLDLDLLLIDTKVARQTKKMVEVAARTRRMFPKIFDNVLDTIELVTSKALELYGELSNVPAGADPEEIRTIYSKLSVLFGLNQGLLNSLGVGHARLDEAIGILDGAGLKGKLTGAGGGGYAICLVPPRMEAKALEEVMGTLEARGFDVIRTCLGGDGVRVEC
ncbi:unnamed protein product [Phyllotreta striolata]|uniref:Mevalonate kinase n=1 Tax=Phyllotreta striolata TaxID=444603 RepID=A0A9N9TPC8_PHYSR|nr:unnamed protein product [Phyllotreta striolata]